MTSVSCCSKLLGGAPCTLRATRKPFSSAASFVKLHRQPSMQVMCQKGFGVSTSKPKKARRRPKPGSELGPEWTKVAKLSDFEEGKPVKPIILSGGKAITLYKVDDEIYASDANSTAFKFPLVNATILDRPEGPAVEVPLDGTIYDLTTGKVITWCPKNNPLRIILGSMKDKSPKENLPVYDATVTEDGTIYVKDLFSS